MMRFRTAAVAALAAGLLLPAAALAQEPSYPEPKDPGKVVAAAEGQGQDAHASASTAASSPGSRPR